MIHALAGNSGVFLENPTDDNMIFNSLEKAKFIY
jgi:hypothetical protein